MLGKLKIVNLKDQWENEQANFTPWLAEEENIKNLGNKLELKLATFKYLLVCKAKKQAEMQRSKS